MVDQEDSILFFNLGYENVFIFVGNYSIISNKFTNIIYDVLVQPLYL